MSLYVGGKFNPIPTVTSMGGIICTRRGLLLGVGSKFFGVV